MRHLHIRSISPGATIQDQGRPGHLIRGLSPGGAADPLALAEGAALLGQSPELAAIELPGMGGIFEASADTRIALTGAPMQAAIDGTPIAWNASHMLHAGQRLTLGATLKGNYGYLHLGGGIATEPFLGARSAHLVAHIGAPLVAGTDLPLGADEGGETGLSLQVADRFTGGNLRIIPSVQTAQFAQSELDRLTATEFKRDPRGNRMGARMNFEGPPFAAADQLNILSEMVVPGDIQVTGDGTPFVLLFECQTTGGYPRIGTVIPPDLPIVAQARAGVPLRFEFVNRDQALAALRERSTHLHALPSLPKPLIRDPHDIRDLLSYQLISGAVSGAEKELL